MDEDIDIGSEMVRELGIDPGADVESDQRLELLREWHRQDSENTGKNEGKE